MERRAVVQMSEEEHRALAASARELMMADARVTAPEVDRVSRFAAELGLTDAQWSAVWDDAVRLDARAAAAAVTRAEARERIYELLYALAMEGDIVDPEWDLLEWLDEVWR